MALLLIDVINPLDLPGGAALLARALPAGARIVASKRRAREAAIPTVYVNDNFDAWHLGFRELVADVRASSPSARQLIDPLEPDPARDHFVLKPRHSGFFRTGLQALLERLGTRTVAVTGIAADICVCFTANDAYMRGYSVVVPGDCVAAEDAEREVQALALMERALGARTAPSTSLDLSTLAHSPRRVDANANRRSR